MLWESVEIETLAVFTIKVELLGNIRIEHYFSDTVRSTNVLGEIAGEHFWGSFQFTVRKTLGHIEKNRRCNRDVVQTRRNSRPNHGTLKLRMC